MSVNESQAFPEKPSPSFEGNEDWKAEARRERQETMKRFNANLAEAKRRGISLDDLLREKGLS